MAAQALVTLDKLKTRLGIALADKSEDALLNDLITEASQAITDWCNTKFNPVATYTEILTGTNTQYIVLKNTPVISITSVYENLDAQWGQADDPWPASNLLVEGQDYSLVTDSDDATQSLSGMVFRINCAWQKIALRSRGLLTTYLGETGSIKVVYSAGWPTVPYPVQTACMKAIARERQGAAYGQAVSGFSYKGFSPSFKAGGDSDGFLTKDVKSLLARYRVLMR